MLKKYMHYTAALAVILTGNALISTQANAARCYCLLGKCTPEGGSDAVCIHRENTQNLPCDSVCRAAATAEGKPLAQQYPTKEGCDIHQALFEKTCKVK